MEFITNTGETVEVEYTYDPGEPDQWYDSNGDPGTPGYGPTAEIKHVWYTKTLLFHFLRIPKREYKKT